MGNLTIDNFRLRSLRTRKRKAKEDLEKYVRQQDKLYNKLWEDKRNIPLIPLEKPYQKGFVRFFVLREDISKTKKADFFLGILEKINTYTYCNDRKFLKKKRKRRKRIYVPRIQKLAQFSEYQLFKNKKPLFTEKEMAYFVKRKEYSPLCKRHITYYEFSEAWRFVLRIRPYIITHYKPLDVDLEAQFEKVSQYLDRHKIQGILQKKIHCHTYSWKSEEKRTEKEKYKYNSLKNNNLIKMKASATQIAEIFEEEY